MTARRESGPRRQRDRAMRRQPGRRRRYARGRTTRRCRPSCFRRRVSALRRGRRRSDGSPPSSHPLERPRSFVRSQSPRPVRRPARSLPARRSRHRRAPRASARPRAAALGRHRAPRAFRRRTRSASGRERARHELSCLRLRRFPQTAAVVRNVPESPSSRPILPMHILSGQPDPRTAQHFPGAR